MLLLHMCFGKLAPSKVRVRNLSRPERFEDYQGQEQTQLLGQEVGSQRGKCVLPMALKGREDRV